MQLVELVADGFKARDFRWWSDRQADLQVYLNGDAIETIKQKTVELNQMVGTAPEDVLVEICAYCGVDWDGDVAPQFLAG